MWTTENRHRYDRDKLHYPSDLTDAEWQHIRPLIPPAAAQHGERLFVPVGLGRHLGEDASRALCQMPGTRRSSSQPNRLHRRHPEREERGKATVLSVKHGFDF